MPLPNVMPAQRQQNIVQIPARNQEASVRKFRLNDIQIDELATEFNQWRQRQLHANGREHNSRKRIELFLHYLSVGGYYRQCGEIFGYAECTVHLYLHEVADFLSTYPLSLFVFLNHRNFLVLQVEFNSPMVTGKM